MRSILITTGIFSPDIGGPASYARSVGASLAGQGIAVTLLTYSSVRTHAGDGTLPFRVCRVWKRIPWGVRHGLFFFRALLYARHADGILALNAATAGFTSAIAARFAGKPLIVRIAGDYAWEIAAQTGRTFLMIDDFQKTRRTGRIGRLHRMQVWTCHRARAVIVPSRYLEGIVTGWGIDPEKIRVIYNGVDFPTVPLSKEDARRKIGVAGTILLSAGRLVPWKGFRMLIKLMPQLLQVNQFFRLVIVGDGPDMAILQSVVRNLGLERKVFLVGRKNAHEMATYLAAADLFVLNTGYEGFSHQILEAMHARVPIITTSVGGNREIIVQGHNGLLVRYNDEFNLGEAIKTVWNNQELREHLIANSAHTVVGFSSDRMKQETLAFLTLTLNP